MGSVGAAGVAQQRDPPSAGTELPSLLGTEQLQGLAVQEQHPWARAGLAETA